MQKNNTDAAVPIRPGDGIGHGSIHGSGKGIFLVRSVDSDSQNPVFGFRQNIGECIFGSHFVIHYLVNSVDWLTEVSLLS
jgi:hypothetical protein